MAKKPVLKKKKILIIDDEEDVVFVLKEFLEKSGYDVSYLTKLDVWDNIFSYGRPDLIFLDYRMRPITGKDVLERLQFDVDPVPVIMMSAYRTDAGVFEVKKLGGYAYIAKPFDFSEIQRLLTAVF